MAYTKTPWANSPAITSPINADNLNKIEDGLFNQDARITVKEAEASGWTVAPGTWTYASATTINVPAGAASIYQVGDKIKLTQNTVKYFYITAVADTLLTVTGGSDYTVESATITSPYYSHQANPLGFPGVFNYTPALAVDSGTAPTYTTTNGKFTITNRTVSGYVQLRNTTGGTAGSGAGVLSCSVPIDFNYPDVPVGTGIIFESGGTLYGLLSVLKYGNLSVIFRSAAYANINGNDQSDANRLLGFSFQYQI